METFLHFWKYIMTAIVLYTGLIGTIHFAPLWGTALVYFILTFFLFDAWDRLLRHRNLAIFCLCSVYVIALPASLLYLQWAVGKPMVLWLVAIVGTFKVTEAFFGMLFKGPHLPKWLNKDKHWSGVLAAFIVTPSLAVLLDDVTTTPIFSPSLYAFIFSIFIVLGDWLEDLLRSRARNVAEERGFKRRYDSVLKYFDSLMLVAPVAVIMWLLRIL